LSDIKVKKPSMWGRLFSGGEKLQPEPDPKPIDPDPKPIPVEPPPQPPAPVTPPTPPEEIPPPVEAPPAEPPPEPQPEQAKKGWFERLRAGLSKTSSKLTDGITSVFIKKKLDAAALEELEDLLIQADLGVDTAARISAALSVGRYNKDISPDEVKAVLAEEVEKVLLPVARPLTIEGGHSPHVILVVGVNGTGKTTTIGKLARIFTADGKRVMLAAGDTFRAAAVEQLKIWAERTGCGIVAGEIGADAAGLAYDALRRAREEGRDILIIDTAGRLQNKANLMAELEKIVRVIRKFDTSAPHTVLLTLDATTGQNALNQVEIFRQTAGVTGLIMTKLDGTARGGILVAIAAKYALPVHAIGVGESAEDLQAFDARDFARAIAGL
jgi:fused signal recognition particle receptor